MPAVFREFSQSWPGLQRKAGVRALDGDIELMFDCCPEADLAGICSVGGRGCSCSQCPGE